MVSGRGGERDWVGEHSVAGGDALAAVSAPRPHLRGALWAAQGDRTTNGELVSWTDSCAGFDCSSGNAAVDGVWAFLHYVHYSWHISNCYSVLHLDLYYNSKHSLQGRAKWICWWFRLQEDWRRAPTRLRSCCCWPLWEESAQICLKGIFLFTIHLGLMF